MRINSFTSLFVACAFQISIVSTISAESLPEGVIGIVSIDDAQELVHILIANESDQDFYVYDNQAFSKAKSPPYVRMKSSSIADAIHRNFSDLVAETDWRVPRALRAYAFPVLPIPVELKPGESISKTWSLSTMLSLECQLSPDGTPILTKLSTDIYFANENHRLELPLDEIWRSTLETPWFIACAT